MPTKKKKKTTTRRAPKLTAAAKKMRFQKASTRGGQSVSAQTAWDRGTDTSYTVWKDEAGAKASDPSKPWTVRGNRFKTQTGAKNEAARLLARARKKKR